MKHFSTLASLRAVAAAVICSVVSACHAGNSASVPSHAPTPTSVYQAKSYAALSATLSAASCPKDQRNVAASSIPLTAAPINPGKPNIVEATQANSVQLAGAWHLTSPHPAFGGLSGLAALANGNLLTVSDSGAFITLNMRDKTPTGTAELTYMLDEQKRMLSNKADGDAEGLTILHDLAFVSFERNHRILAFDLLACGAAARGIPVAHLPHHVDGTSVDDNRGAEALAYLGATDALVFQYEAPKNGMFITGAMESDHTLTLDMEPVRYQGYAAVGSDIVSISDTAFAKAQLYRSYDPIRGNRNMLDVFLYDDQTVTDVYRLNLQRPFETDNFEGVAISLQPDGTLRIWIISDNNFSERQRTLLYAFDIPAPLTQKIAASSHR